MILYISFSYNVCFVLRVVKFYLCIWQIKFTYVTKQSKYYTNVFFLLNRGCHHHTDSRHMCLKLFPPSCIRITTHQLIVPFHLPLTHTIPTSATVTKNIKSRFSTVSVISKSQLDKQTSYTPVRML